VCDSDRLSNAAELAEILGIPISTVYDRARRSRWPVYQIGHARRWRASEVLALCRIEPDSDDLDSNDVARRVSAGLRGQAVRRR
jgi:hypothetical protein